MARIMLVVGLTYLSEKTTRAMLHAVISSSDLLAPSLLNTFPFCHTSYSNLNTVFSAFNNSDISYLLNPDLKFLFIFSYKDLRVHFFVEHQ